MKARQLFATAAHRYYLYSTDQIVRAYLSLRHWSVLATTMSRMGAPMLAHQVHPSTLVDALAHFEYPQASQQPAGRMYSLQRPILLTSTAIRHRSPSSPPPFGRWQSWRRHRPRLAWPPHSHRIATSVQTLTPNASYSVCAIVNADTPRVQILILAVIGPLSSVLLQLLCLSLTPRLLQPLSSIQCDPPRRPTPIGLLYDPRDRRAIPQGP